MTYKNNNKNYEVENITYGGMYIQVNGTTITDCDLQAKTFGYSWYKPNGDFSVFVDSNEMVFNSFEQAYVFATTKQRNTFSI